MRYVHPLRDPQRDLLENPMTHDTSPRARARAHSLIRSAQGMTINAITKISQVDRDTVATWIRTWEHDGPASLHDQPRSGRPPKLTPAEQTLAIAYIKEEPRSLKQVVERFANTTEKRLSISSLMIPPCSMPPKFLKFLKRGYENASRGSLGNPPLASICA